MNSIIDGYFRKVSSKLYRIVLLVLVILNVIFTGGFFDVRLHILIITCYAILYIFLYRKDYRWKKVSPFIRLTIDYILIVSSVVGSSLVNPLVPVTILLPVINSQNHTGTKKSFFIYVYIFVCFLVATGYEYIYFVLCISLILAVIGLVQEFRQYFVQLIYEIEKNIYNYCGKDIHLTKTYKIYTDLIDRLSKTPLKSQFKLKDIYCFRKTGKSLTLVNSSTLTINVTFKDLEKILDDNKKDEILIDLQVHVDGKGIDHTIGFFIEDVVDANYLFLLSFSEKPSIFFVHVITRLLKPVFERIVRVLEAEKIINQERDEALKIIKGRIEYVNKATLAMHFLRNKLGPVFGYFDLQNNLNEVSDLEKRQALEELLEEERVLSNKAIPIVLDRIDFILEKSKNPYIVGEKKKVMIGNLLASIRNIWTSTLPGFKIESAVSEKVFKKSVTINEEYFEVGVTDIVANIVKYHQGKASLYLSSNGANLIVMFSNSVKTKDPGYSSLNALVNDYNSGNVLEIFRRKTFGIYFIKTIFDQMGVISKMSLDRDILSLTLCIKKD
jgi:hypothetical protein